MIKVVGTTPASPFPLLRDVGSNLNHRRRTDLTSEDATVAAPPLFEGMWAAYTRSTEEWGTQKHEGGPMKWEARVVRHENGPRQMSWPVCSLFLAFLPS
jgi:hypothetical protein